MSVPLINNFYIFFFFQIWFKIKIKRKFDDHSFNLKNLIYYFYSFYIFRIQKKKNHVSNLKLDDFNSDLNHHFLIKNK